MQHCHSLPQTPDISVKGSVSHIPDSSHKLRPGYPAVIYYNILLLLEEYEEENLYLCVTYDSREPEERQYFRLAH